MVVKTNTNFDYLPIPKRLEKYPSIMRSWDANWANLSTIFQYPEEIRRQIYTTNTVEGYHRMVRKFTKSKAIFQTDDSIRKAVYLSVKEISKKWSLPVRDWGLVYSQVMIYFEVYPFGAYR